MNRDTTGLKRPAGVLCNAEANLSALIESTEDAVWSVDLNYRLVTFNRALQAAFERSFGVLAALGMGPDDLLPPERAALFAPLYERALSEGPFRTEYSLLDGRTLELSFNPIRQNGQAVGISVFGKDITERKTAEIALREAERKYRSIFEGAVEGIYRTSIEGKSLAANPALAKILGYDSPEDGTTAVTDTACQVWLDPKERSRFVKLLEDRGAVRGYECQFKRKDGEAIWVSLSSRLVCDEDGRALYSEGFVETITERKQTECALRKSQEKFAKLFRCSPAVVTLCDLTDDGRFIDVNEAFELTNGYRREEAIGRTAGELGLWPNFPEFDESVKQFRATGRLHNFRHQFRKKNGGIGTGLTSVEVIDIDGKPVAISATIDITEQLEAERRLQAEGKRFQTIVEHTDAGYFRIGVDGCYEDMNSAWLRMHGFTGRDQAIGLHFSAVQVPDDVTKAGQVVEALVQGGPARTGEFSRQYRDGTVGYHSFSASPVFDGDRVIAIEGFLVDISDRKKAEQERQRTEERFRTLFDSMQEGVAIHELLHTNGTPQNYILLEVNRRYEEILGVKREDVVNKLATDVYGVQSAPYVKEYASVVEAGTPSKFETYFAPMDKHFVISVAPMGDERFATIFFDITEQKKTELAIQQAHESVAKAEAHYRLMFNSVSDAIFVFTADEGGVPSNFLEVNDAACRYLGYTRDELLKMQIFDVAGPELDSDIPHLIQRLRAANGRLMYEGNDVAKDGRRIPVEVNTRLVDLDGVQTLISCVRDISDRKEAEKQYREIFNGALEGIYRTSLEGRNLAANPALATMLGYDSAQEVVSKVTDSARQVWVDPDERAKFMRLLAHDGIVRGFECQYRRKDGTKIWVALSSRMVYGEDGRILYTEGFVEDIAERKRIQDALRKSEEKFVKVFLSNPAMGMLFKPEEEGNRIADVNEAFEQVTGYRREELLGRTSKELGLWVDPARFDEFRRLLRTDGRVRNFEFQFYNKTGKIRTGLMSAEWLELEGRDWAISATIDITEQKKAEESIRSLVTAIEQTGEAIVVTDVDGAIQYCNPAFEKVTGYSKDEAIGANPRILKSGKHSAEFYEEMWATLMRGAVWSGHLTNQRKDGSLFEEDATISPIRDALDKLSGFVAVKRDVTERRQLEDQLRQAQKLESIGRLAGGVAHDFNNLLTVINGYGDFLLKGLKSGDRLRSYAEEIKTAGERAASLTNQLLAFSRKQVIEPKAVDLNAIIRESTVMLQRLIGDDIALQTHLDVSLGQVMADPDQIHQVIVNLAVNARDSMPDGGALDTETLNVELGKDDSAAMHPDAVPGRYVLLSVTDTGHGMDEATCQRIFEPFFTTKALGKGTGLGLSTVYGIVRQSGGWINVWSEVGVGTTFKIYFPRMDASRVPQRDPVSTLAEGGSETILVVEDQQAVRSFAKAALRQRGYLVIEASDGDEALSVAEQHSGQIDLLVTDVIMPGLDGRELSEHLGRLYPNLKVLFMSGYTADVIAHRGVLEPSVWFLHKPFSQEELAQKVRARLDQPL
jgi:PAS domain S-box-containing protein